MERGAHRHGKDFAAQQTVALGYAYQEIHSIVRLWFKSETIRVYFFPAPPDASCLGLPALARISATLTSCPDLQLGFRL